MNKAFNFSLLLKSLKIGCFFSVFLFEIVLLFVAVYTLATLFFMIIGTGRIPSDKEIVIYMKSDGIHTDFVFPIQSTVVDWRTIFPLSDTKTSESNFSHISIGWGDQGFFLNTPQWSDLKLSTALTACFYLGKTAIHTNYINLKDINVKCIRLSISQKQYKALYSYINSSLKKGVNGQINCIHNKGYWNTDSFYQANGSYGLFFTCNTWINTGLKTADLPACLWTPLNCGIFRNYNTMEFAVK